MINREAIKRKLMYSSFLSTFPIVVKPKENYVVKNVEYYDWTKSEMFPVCLFLLFYYLLSSLRSPSSQAISRSISHEVGLLLSDVIAWAKLFRLMLGTLSLRTERVENLLAISSGRWSCLHFFGKMFRTSESNYSSTANYPHATLQIQPWVPSKKFLTIRRSPS